MFKIKKIKLFLEGNAAKNFKHKVTFFFYVLLTVHRRVTLVTGQINHKFLFYNKFIKFLYMFRALCAHHQEVKTILYNIWYRHTL